MSPPSSGLKSDKSSVSVGILLGLFDPKDGSDVPPKRRLTFNGLHGTISQMIGLFIATTVRTSNPTNENSLENFQTKF
jgi:hypothetical protein